MSKSVSVEEAIARIEKDLEENETHEEGVIRAAPTGPTTPIMPREHFEIGSLLDNGDFRPLTDNESTIHYETIARSLLVGNDIENDSGITTSAPPVGPVYTPPTFEEQDQPLILEELITKLESETEASLYQELWEKYTRICGELPDPAISDVLESLASLEHLRRQYLLNILKAPRVEPNPIEERQCLNRLGELFEVAREEGETDEAYRERIRQRAFPYTDPPYIS